MRRLILILICSGGLMGVAQPGKPRPADSKEARRIAREDLKKLQGTWDRVTMEVDGEAVGSEKIEGWTAGYEDDLLTLNGPDGPYRRGIVTLDPGHSPKATNTWDLDGPFADRTVPGIYDLDGDKLRVCFARPGEDRPTEFTTKRGTGFLLCVYKRRQP